MTNVDDSINNNNTIDGSVEAMNVVAARQDGTANNNSNDDNDNGAACATGAAAADGTDNSRNSKSNSSKQRKASRWKQLNEKKRSNKRKLIMDKKDAGDWDRDKRPDVKHQGGGGEDESSKQHHHQQLQPTKQQYDKRKSMYDNPIPNEGSFANKTMRSLFNIDLPEYENVALTPNNKYANADGDGGEVVVVGTNDKIAAAAAAATTTTMTMTDNVNSSMAMSSSISTTETLPVENDEHKVPKRKLALLISFLGTNYSGFQINGGQKTLQSMIELGLYKSGIISAYNFGFPQKYAWSNSARTDKGVHAAAQVCSLKGEMICHNTTADANGDINDNNERQQLDNMRECINKHLPSDIRILDIERVTRMFCARTNRDKVRYQYMIPSYLFCSEEEVQKIFSNVKVLNDSSSNATTAKDTTNAATHTVDGVDVISNEDRVYARTKLSSYRILPEQMDKLRDGLHMFEGTHSFHNYTRRLSSSDASSTRYILSFQPLLPIIVNDTQWIPVQVVGQSFLLNQIRKMVSAAVDYARGAVTQETIHQSLSKDCRMKVNVAPAQGLFLDRSYFELYNKHKIKNTPKKKLNNNDNQNTVPTLDWVENDGVEGRTLPNPAVRRIEEFKNEKIIPHIVKEEVKEGNFIQYMYSHHVNFHDMYSLIGGVGDEMKRR
jgi:tRNA pseudouridine(38-40) synthase